MPTEKATTFPTKGNIVVLSPHLDDAALSLGAGIARATAAGARVRIITVFAYEPESTAPAGEWDRACGFRTAGEAARTRRAEDARACALLGAEPVWLPFRDFEYGRNASESEVWEAVAAVTEPESHFFLPGFPLVTPDHKWLTHLFLRRPVKSRNVGLYVEQPYAAWRLIGRGRRSGAEALTTRRGLMHLLQIGLRTEGGRRVLQPSFPTEFETLLDRPVTWTAVPSTRKERRLKRRAIREYRSQVAHFGPLVLARMSVCEAGWGGEGIAFVRQ
jgi:LmbE family N-acetylglucosaminyl deacetylase